MDPMPWNPNYGVVGSGDRRLAFSRQLSLSSSSASSTTPRLARSDSSISMPPHLVPTPAFRWLVTRPMRRLALLIGLNVAYSVTELAIGLFTGRVGLVSDAFHLTFGCGLLTFSLFAMAASRTKPDSVYTYGYKRLEVLAAFTNAIQFGGLILASWFLSLGVENAEVLCLGIVSVAVFMLVLPLFKATGNILLQIAPGNVPPSAFIKCCRQMTACEDVSEVCQARFWELVPGHAVGSLSIRVKNGGYDESSVLEYVHGLYQDLGIQDLTIQFQTEEES